MENLKTIIVSRLQWLTVIILLLILPVASYLQVLVLQRQARDNAQAAFHQIQQILEENTNELETVTEEYRQTCLLNAESIAYMIQYHPEILGDIEEFRKIAQMMEVDEIHIFDKTGRIFTGTHPEYYDFKFTDGEQIGFFAPLLEDYSLKLCQEVTPNTAEGVLVQYSALWSADREFIVQVGMYPETILEYTEKNELSYIFSLLQGSAGVNFYAVDADTQTVMGATSEEDMGKTLEQLGFSVDAMPQYQKGSHVTVNGVDSYCVFTDMDGTLIGYSVSTDTLYNSVMVYTLLLTVCLGAILILIVVLMWRFNRKYIVESIHLVNSTLSAVSEGNLDARVDVQSSMEFSQLSNHINHMIRSLLATTDKMGFVLDHTNMRIGVYEYSTHMKTVRFTEHIPEILKWDSRTRARLSSDYRLLQEYLDKILLNPVPGEKNTFLLNGKREVYIKLEEVVNGTDTLGILIDVTEEIITRRRIEQERDIDLLTGLYNRRAMEYQLAGIFKEDTGCGALVMVDADGLKHVNDVYGHTVGDRYLQRVAEGLSGIGRAQHMAFRMGGDEFVVLLYGYSTETEVFKDLEEIRCIQKNTNLELEDASLIPVRFSFGYVLTAGRKDYTAMISEADGHMYAVKRKRKRAEDAKEAEA